ncbi:MAG: MMPL family transporter [Desulfobacteraceae bacterium]|jgi:hypothetical protein
MIIKILNFFLGMALDRRKTVLITSTILTIVAIVLSTYIHLDMQWTTLLPETNPVVKEYIRVTEDYPLGSNYIITVENQASDKIETAIDMIETQLSTLQDSISTTYGKTDEQFLLNHGLRTIKPKDLKRAVKIFSDIRVTQYLTHLNDDFEREFSGDSEKVKDQERELVQNVQAIESFIDILSSVSKGEELDETALDRTIRDLTSGNPYQLSLDKKMGLIMVAVKYPPTDLEGALRADKEIIAAMEKIRPKLPEGTQLGTTGVIPISRDEMDSVGPYTTVLFLIAMILVFVALVWNFRSILVPLLALTPIIIGIIWSMGFYALTVKNLNIFTAMIMLVLIGLGIDFSIHMVTRFFEERSKGVSQAEALHHGVLSTGKGIFTGAVTTAMAFFALMTGSTKGTIEFGFCAGSGVMITLLALFMVLPSLLVWWDNKHSKKKKNIRFRKFDFLGRSTQIITGRRYIFVALTLILSGAAFGAINMIQYEYNMMELEPAGLTSIKLQDDIVARFKMSTEMAYVTCESVEECRQLAKKLKKKKVVGEVGSIDRFIPAPDWVAQNDRTIETLRQNLEVDHPKENYATKASKNQLSEQLTRLLYNLIEIEELSFIGGQDRVVAAIETLTGGEAGNGKLANLTKRFDQGRLDWEKVEKTGHLFSEKMTQRLKTMSAHSGSITEAMVPSKYTNLYKNEKTGKYLVQIYPKRNLYDRQSLVRFNTVTQTVSDRIAGMPKLILLINDEMVKDGWRALLASGIVILILLLLDLRSLTAVGLAIIPLVFGSLWMLAAMGLLGIKLNFVNIIAVPVIIGIGVDDGIHIVHRWRQEGMGGLSKATAKVGHAILMTSFTTMIGFGGVGFYTHRGMASLGYVLFIGVGFCFLSTILILPAFGSLVEKKIIKNQAFRKVNEHATI